MTTLLERDVANMEKDWFDDEFPIGLFGIVIFSGLVAFLLAITYEWSAFTFLEGALNAILLLGFACYFGRQVYDITWIYFVLSYKERYVTMVEKKKIAYDSTKHVARTIYLVLLAPTLYLFNEAVHFLWFIPVFASFFLFPIFYRILANKAQKNVEEKEKKTPVQRISADGKIDLSNLPFVFENLDTHGITNENVKKAYQKVQSYLDYVTMRVALIDDIEIVHTLKRMGEEELPRLLRSATAPS